jgi:hypothetical protein
MTRSEELFFDIRTINNIRKDMACNLLAGTSEFMSMCITWFLQNYLKKIISKIFLGRSHMGTLIGAKISLWHPLQVASRVCALLAIP